MCVCVCMCACVNGEARVMCSSVQSPVTLEFLIGSLDNSMTSNNKERSEIIFSSRTRQRHNDRREDLVCNGGPSCYDVLPQLLRELYTSIQYLVKFNSYYIHLYHSL